MSAWKSCSEIGVRVYGLAISFKLLCRSLLLPVFIEVRAEDDCEKQHGDLDLVVSQDHHEVGDRHVSANRGALPPVILRRGSSRPKSA